MGVSITPTYDSIQVGRFTFVQVIFTTSQDECTFMHSGGTNGVGSVTLVSSTGDGMYYEFRVDGLKAGTEYFYITGNTNDSGSGNFELNVVANQQTQYTCYLKYDANGGSGAPSTQVYTSSATSNHTFTVSSTKPSRSGYTFNHWVGSDGRNYSPGGTVTVPYNGTVTLTAYWKENAPVVIPTISGPTSITSGSTNTWTASGGTFNSSSCRFHWSTSGPTVSGTDLSNSGNGSLTARITTTTVGTVTFYVTNAEGRTSANYVVTVYPENVEPPEPKLYWSKSIGGTEITTLSMEASTTSTIYLCAENIDTGSWSLSSTNESAVTAVFGSSSTSSNVRYYSVTLSAGSSSGASTISGGLYSYTARLSVSVAGGSSEGPAFSLEWVSGNASTAPLGDLTLYVGSSATAYLQSAIRETPAVSPSGYGYISSSSATLSTTNSFAYYYSVRVTAVAVGTEYLQATTSEGSAFLRVIVIEEEEEDRDRGYYDSDWNPVTTLFAKYQQTSTYYFYDPDGASGYSFTTDDGMAELDRAVVDDKTVRISITGKRGGVTQVKHTSSSGTGSITLKIEGFSMWVEAYDSTEPVESIDIMEGATRTMYFCSQDYEGVESRVSDSDLLEVDMGGMVNLGSGRYWFSVYILGHGTGTGTVYATDSAGEVPLEVNVESGIIDGEGDSGGAGTGSDSILTKGLTIEPTTLRLAKGASGTIRAVVTPTDSDSGFNLVEAGINSDGKNFFTTSKTQTGNVLDLTITASSSDLGVGAVIVSSGTGSKSVKIAVVEDGDYDLDDVHTNYIAIRNDRGTSLFHLPHIISIEDTVTASLTEINTIIYGAENRFVMDLGTQQRYSIKLNRVNPPNYDDDSSSDLRWSNGTWWNRFRRALDFWQNLGMSYDAGGDDLIGGFRLHIEPSDDTLYPLIDKNVFLSGTITPQFNVQNMSLTLPVRVARMKESQSDVPTATLTCIVAGDGLDESFTVTVPTNQLVLAPQIPANVSAKLGGRVISGWKFGTSTIHMGEYVTWSPGQYTLTAELKPIIYSISFSQDSLPTGVSLDSEFPIQVLEDLGVSKVNVTLVGGGGGAGAGNSVSFATVKYHLSGGGGGAGEVIDYTMPITGGEWIRCVVGSGGSGKTDRSNETGGSGNPTMISTGFVDEELSNRNGGRDITARGGNGGQAAPKPISKAPGGVSDHQPSWSVVKGGAEYSRGGSIYAGTEGYAGIKGSRAEVGFTGDTEKGERGLAMANREDGNSYFSAAPGGGASALNRTVNGILYISKGGNGNNTGKNGGKGTIGGGGGGCCYDNKIFGSDPKGGNGGAGLIVLAFY